MRRFLVKLGRVEHRLRWDAADVETSAAERGPLLDHRALHAELRRADGAHIAAGAGADDDEIVGHEKTPELLIVMAGLVPAIHVSFDARHHRRTKRRRSSNGHGRA